MVLKRSMELEITSGSLFGKEKVLTADNSLLIKRALETLASREYGSLYSMLRPTLLCPTPKKQRLSKKTVRFDDEKNSVKYRYMSRKALRRSWMQPEDYKNIRENNKQSLIAIKGACGDISCLDATAVCVRGLEFQISVFIFKKDRFRQRDHVRAILERQRAQKGMGIYNTEDLRSLSVVLSQPDRMKALRLATIDSFS